MMLNKARQMMQNSSIVNMAKRKHTVFNKKTYNTGFDRMILDKFNAIRILPKLSIFGILGLTNAFCYGLSHFMSEKDYHYYFAYEGDGRGSKLIRGMIGTDRFANAVWTIPTLLMLGIHMQSRVGAVTMLKFGTLTMVATASSWMAFGPND
jgi:hypothetical protein